VVALLVSRLASRNVARACRIALAAIFVAQVALVFGVALGPVTYRELAAAALLVGAGALAESLAFARGWLRRARDPLVLEPPFEGRWRVGAGGPFPGLNHHVIARDQFFAYDFIRVGAKSFGSAILAPLAGTVAASSDGMGDRASSFRPDDPSVVGRELGNYVAIETAQGYVFLCHLANGSVRVRTGDRVAAGDEVGRCGNSGRTTRPHLHIHAQDEPAYSFDRARGIPIAFRERGATKLLRPLGVLSGR